MPAAVKVALAAAIREGKSACEKCECVNAGSLTSDGKFRISIKCHDDATATAAGRFCGLS